VAHPPPPALDTARRYRAGGIISYFVVGFYLVLLALALLVVRAPASDPWVGWILGVLVLLFLARYLSTSYVIDHEYLRAWRILGGRKVRLKDVRRIEYASLRDLSATGFWGSWGWRGRMWSPRIGRFDSIYTETKGLLVTAGDFPLYISPKREDEFAQELSRRVRSLGGRLISDSSES
jgi:hypothetical protein